MRYQEIIRESVEQSYRLLHGSPYPDISEFRLDNLRHRTGTPGTLSFTTNIDTAKIYGKYVYEVEVTGIFGDYLNPEDIQKNFDARWPKEEARITYRHLHKMHPHYEKISLEDALEETANKMKKDLALGRYEMWENSFVWKTCGWDGAWCHEDNRNLIIGNIKCVRLIGKVD
jgi:hypothetical protein